MSISTLNLNNVVDRKENAMSKEMTLDAQGNKIKALQCMKCGYKSNKMNWSDQCDNQDYTTVRVECTLGHYGPNGNGYNYWCPKDEHRMTIVKNPYSALDQLFGFNQ